MWRLCPENVLTCTKGFIWVLSQQLLLHLQVKSSILETESVPGVFRWISISRNERAVNSVLFKAKERKTCVCPQHKDVFTFSGTALLT